MKKSLLALAVLGTFAGVASAQSSVTLYGTVDLNGRYIKNTGQQRRLSLSQDGINSSQLGFKGTEDLGGGLKAGFLLLAGVNADSGTANPKFWNRRSTVSLWGNFGEVRLGRDYTPTFWNTSVFDTFGTNGIGESNDIKQMVAADYIRADNMIQYFLPSNIGGVYGNVSAAAGEGASSGRYVGGRLGFASGGLDVAVAASEEKVLSVYNVGANNNGVATAAPTGSSFVPSSAGAFGINGLSGNQQYKTGNIGASYDFGFLKLLGFFNYEKLGDAKDKTAHLGAIIPLGQGEIHVGGNYGKFNGGGYSNKVKRASLGYNYNLSKRTALYATASYLDNGDDSALTLGAGGIANPATGSYYSHLPNVGGKSKGVEVGLRHFF